LEVRRSAVHGHGTFALRNLPQGRTVGTYEGRRYAPGKESEKDWDHGLTYVFGLSDGSLIDGSDGGNATRHINHSCEPICEAYEVTDDDGEVCIMIQALRPIRAGEELFIDYRLNVGDDDPASYPCRCGAARCRGTMVALAEEEEDATEAVPVD
jgi:SET domain-containing protein